MKLSREIIQRMVTDRVGGGGAGGGGGISMDDIQGMGFATEQWVNEKYLSIDFFNRLFQAYDSAATPNQVLPNDLESTITNIKAMFGFWTEQFVSVLGYGPGGGGGGDTLTEPLASINNAGLGTPTAAGQVITWNGSEWIFDIPQGGGGGGTGTVTSITAGTGLSGGTITTSGTIAISSNYRARIALGETAYGWGNHADAGYLTSADLPALGISNGVITIGNNTITPVTQVAMTVPTGFTISGSPVTKSGTLALGFTSGYSLPTTAKQSQWDTAYSERHTHSNKSVLDGITSTKVSNWDTAYGWGNHADAGYLTSADLPALGISNGVITIGNNTITPVTQVAMTVPTGFTISGSPVTKSGTLALGFTSGYSLPTTAKQSQWDTAYSERHTHSNKSVLDGITSTKVSNWDTAYGWGNHANAGYMLRTEGMRFLVQDRYIAARFVTASGAYDAARVAKAQGEGYIEWWSSGDYFNHEMGFIRAKGNVEVGTSTTDTTHYLQIGGGRLYWDSANNALYVQKVDSQGNVTAANFYATGGVSALGMSVGGTPSMNTLTLQNLTVNGSATINTLAVTNEIETLVVNTMDVANELWLNGNSIYMDGGNIEDAYKVQTTQMIVGSGGSTIKKIYWDGTYLQVQIGTTTYKFRPDVTS